MRNRDFMREYSKFKFQVLIKNVYGIIINTYFITQVRKKCMKPLVFNIQTLRHQY